MSDDEQPAIDTTNKFLAGVRGDRVVFLRPVPQHLTRADALLLAAYLVSLVGDDDEWQRVLTAVQNT